MDPSCKFLCPVLTAEQLLIITKTKIYIAVTAAVQSQAHSPWLLIKHSGDYCLMANPATPPLLKLVCMHVQFKP